MLEPAELLSLASDAKKVVLKTTPKALARIATPTGGRVVVVGDLHGQLADLCWILSTCGLPSASNIILFNGDFVDRGPQSVEVITVILMLKVLFPDFVHLNRGNHEDPMQNLDFEEEFQHKYGKVQGKKLWWAFNDVFGVIPLCTLVDDRTFVTHGGLPREAGWTVSQLEALPFHRFMPSPGDQKLTSEEMAFLDLTWADPVDVPGISESERCPGGFLANFGPDVTSDFMEKNGLSLIVRSHEPPENFAGAHPHHDGKLITVFSASNYCGDMGNEAAVFLLNHDGKNGIVSYHAPSLRDQARRELSTSAKEALKLPSMLSLQAYFSEMAESV